MSELWYHVGISPLGALGVVGAAIVLYLVYAAVLAVWGPRLFSSSSTLSIALLTVLGGLFARAMLGNSPTLAGALIAAGTLLVLEALLGRLRRGSRHGRRHRPRVIMVAGAVVPQPAGARLISEADLLAKLRIAGVRSVGEVAVAILEARGSLTILRRGDRIEPEMLRGVQGAELVPASCVGGDDG